LRRFDRSRLQAVALHSVSARRCEHTDALLAACRADLRDRPLVVLGCDDAEVARRVCLQLDGSWCMQDASAPGRWTIRLRALLSDLATSVQPQAAWDTGWARNPAALHGLQPRRPTLIVLEAELDPGALTDLARQSRAWRRPVRLLVLPVLRPAPG
jgi:hypothetical protein